MIYEPLGPPLDILIQKGFLYCFNIGFYKKIITTPGCAHRSPSGTEGPRKG
jgi:hypothetical protein